MPEACEPMKFTDLDWSMKNPCADCPFTKSAPFHRGVCRSIPDYFDTIRRNNFSHTCHKTDNRPACDGPKNYQGDKPQHCIGSILMLLKTGDGYDLQLPLLRAEAAENVFTLQGMLRFYRKALQDLIRGED